MRLEFADRREFDLFTETLETRLTHRPPRAITRPGLRESAVLLPILYKDGQTHVLLTLRTDKVRTHKNQISLPGGGRDQGDRDVVHTALRETHEEVGIAPDDVRILGIFDDFISIYGFHVATVVGIIPHPYDYAVNPDEIDACIEVPLALFRDRRYDRVQKVEFEGAAYNMYHYLFGGFEIWGLTARILTDFADALLHDPA